LYKTENRSIRHKANKNSPTAYRRIIGAGRCIRVGSSAKIAELFSKATKEMETPQQERLSEETVTLRTFADQPISHVIHVTRIGRPDKEVASKPSQSDVWAYIWGCSPLLAELVLSIGLQDLRVLEVGSGLGTYVCCLLIYSP